MHFFKTKQKQKTKKITAVVYKHLQHLDKLNGFLYQWEKKLILTYIIAVHYSVNKTVSQKIHWH